MESLSEFSWFLLYFIPLNILIVLVDFVLEYIEYSKIERTIGELIGLTVVTCLSVVGTATFIVMMVEREGNLLRYFGAITRRIGRKNIRLWGKR